MVSPQYVLLFLYGSELNCIVFSNLIIPSGGSTTKNLLVIRSYILQFLDCYSKVTALVLLLWITAILAQFDNIANSNLWYHLVEFHRNLFLDLYTLNFFIDCSFSFCWLYVNFLHCIKTPSVGKQYPLQVVSLICYCKN